MIGSGFGQTLADEYDFENRLITRHTATNTILFTYDGDGNRVSKTIITSTNTLHTYYVVDELNPSGYAQVLEEHVSTNSQAAVINCVFVVTSGTGSGKSLTYIGTIFDRLLKAPQPGKVSAVIVYPMNALINSQADEVER